jgi:hypothetical protein
MNSVGRALSKAKSLIDNSKQKVLQITGNQKIDDVEFDFLKDKWSDLCASLKAIESGR